MTATSTDLDSARRSVTPPRRCRPRRPALAIRRTWPARFSTRATPVGLRASCLAFASKRIRADRSRTSSVQSLNSAGEGILDAKGAFMEVISPVEARSPRLKGFVLERLQFTRDSHDDMINARVDRDEVRHDPPALTEAEWRERTTDAVARTGLCCTLMNSG
jgi:hypothetical protein